ncbi:MAG TPA: isochorismate synthase [Actinomycetota bacterium]|nr:isochorismate synthase [Actinomycetota bacterium]
MTELRIRTVPADAAPDLLRHLARPDGVAWLHHGDGFVAWGEAARLEVRGADRFEEARAWLSELAARAEVDDAVDAPGTGLVAFGAFSFDEDSPGSTFIVPAVLVGRRHGRSWMTRIDEPPPAVGETDNGRIRYAGSTLPDVKWLEAVDSVARSVRAGEAEKVVLARDVHVWTRGALDPRPVARRLGSRFPECYTFVIDGLIGATPELLVRRIGSGLESLVLAGSARRGKTRTEDQELGRRLLLSTKDSAEHRPAVEQVRRVLEPLTRDLKATNEPFLLRLANVQHLATSFVGDLTGGEDALEIVAALHPTPAVCGTPTKRAVRMIRELEGMDRGRYAGPVGWMDARGDGEWGIALRCAQFDGTRGRLFAGAGIVAGSLPEAELEETRIKLRAMQNALDADTSP